MGSKTHICQVAKFKTFLYHRLPFATLLASISLIQQQNTLALYNCKVLCYFLISQFALSALKSIRQTTYSFSKPGLLNKLLRDTLME